MFEVMGAMSRRFGRGLGSNDRGPSWDRRLRPREASGARDAFAETARREEQRRRALVSELRSYIQAGLYVPNLLIIAEKILLES